MMYAFDEIMVHKINVA